MKNILVVEDNMVRIGYFISNFDARKNNLAFYYAENYDKAIEYLSSIDFNLIFLDHDLGDNSKDGADIAQWMVDNNKSNILTVIHTMNPIGRDDIKNILPDGIVSSSIWLNSELLQEYISIC